MLNQLEGTHALLYTCQYRTEVKHADLRQFGVKTAFYSRGGKGECWVSNECGPIQNDGILKS